ncbi:trypsin-like peptidase domain-containing protein [Micromonospora sp. Llam7]|uniref:trypsin-like peptidase domain-containing protein n=1 Tax=Micromonospora tarapacensis TaxID=2835305 RepID=UPI001C829C23|nr:trypsin-like peptidase domain-containing protein [Micromonospora tarapacensis]MBX7268691.1 trypsin-like peptidase domain-containing protein [Micromonospora tarapacensis]
MPAAPVALPADPPPYDPFAAPGRRIRPSPPPKRRTGLLASVAALLLVATVGGTAALWIAMADGPDEPTAAPTTTTLAPGIEPWAEAVPRSPQERALATAAPAVVFLETTITGYVRNKQDAVLLHPEPFTFSRRCTGVVVRHDGQVLTNAQCVRPSADLMLGHGLAELARTLVAAGRLKPEEVDAHTRAHTATTVFTGREPGAQPESRLYGQLNVATGDRTDSPAIPGTVVQTLPVAEGNLALVELDETDLPAVAVNTSTEIAPETALLVLGYGTTDTEYRFATYRVLAKPVQVTEVDLASSAYRVSDDVGASSRGGVVVDQQGRVVGMLDNDLLRPDRANRLTVPAARMTGLLDTAGIDNSLGEPDELYREGLDAYFGGDERGAAALFDVVVERSPRNALAQAYREAARTTGGAESDRTGWLVPVLIAAGVALAGGLTLVAVLRRRGNR